MQDLLVRQQDRRVHWRLRAESHDQHIIRAPATVLHLLKSNAFSLLQKDAFAAIKYWWAIKIR